MTYSLVWDPLNGRVNDSIIKRDEDGAFIPFDEGNRDYQEYRHWLEDGNTPAQAEMPPPPPPPGPSLDDIMNLLLELKGRIEKLEDK